MRLRVFLTKPFAVSIDLDERHPWEAIERHPTNTSVKQLYLRWAYPAVGEAPGHHGTDAAAPRSTREDQLTEITLEIADMKCEGCTKAVHDALSGLSGVHNVKVSLEDKTATLDIDDSVTLGHLTHVVETAGYKATLKT